MSTLPPASRNSTLVAVLLPSPGGSNWSRPSWDSPTCSVCTGSLILGAAGLLKGLRATSHWAVRERLTEFGATPEASRWIEQGRIVTAAGVSAGIDMALHLVSLIANESVAKAIQLGIEYDPQPPFDSGAIEKATPDVVTAVANGTIAMNREGRARPRLPRLG